MKKKNFVFLNSNYLLLLFIENILGVFDWLRAKGEIVISAWKLPKFGVETKYTTL